MIDAARFALDLAGWEDRSIWGYDPTVGSLFAQLTRNGNNDDNGPDIWITPPAFPPITTPAMLARAIAIATQNPTSAVHEALNDAVASQGAPEEFLTSPSV